MSKPRIQVRKRRELNEHLDHAVGEDVDRMVELDRMVDEFVTSAKRMNIQPMTLVFKTNQLREIARKILFRQFLSTYTKVLEEPTQEELEIMHKEVEKLCEIIYDVSFRTLIARDAMRAQAPRANAVPKWARPLRCRAVRVSHTSPARNAPIMLIKRKLG
jgi:hypothetical protein